MARLALALPGLLRPTLDDQPVASLAYAKGPRAAGLSGRRAPPARRSLRMALTTLRHALGDQLTFVLTYVPMSAGFLYLLAIMDWFSRCHLVQLSARIPHP
jgi:hypothetical protein